MFSSFALLIALTACAPLPPPVHFMSGKDSISDDNKPNNQAINEAVRILKERPGYSLLIVGLADKSGDAKSNVALSKKRAESIKAKIIKRVPEAADRVDTHGIGERKSTKKHKRGQRRVEFIFYKDHGQKKVEIVNKSRAF